MTELSGPPNPSFVAVVACTPSGVIGLNGGMPWKLGSDLRRFKAMTMGGTLVMGRKTFDSIGKPLPGRKTIVLTRVPPTISESVAHDNPAGVDASNSQISWRKSVDEVLSLSAVLGKSTYVVGGAEIYRLFMPFYAEIWLTQVWSAVLGDTSIDLPLKDYHLSECVRYPQTGQDSVPTEFRRYKRKKSENFF